jgi:hypothetical protein
MMLKLTKGLPEAELFGATLVEVSLKLLLRLVPSGRPHPDWISELSAAPLALLVFSVSINSTADIFRSVYLHSASNQISEFF